MNIPEELEKYILSWCFLHHEEKILQQICKKWKKIVKTCKPFIKRARLQNGLKMLLEDATKHQKVHMKSLGSQWESYSKWGWTLHTHEYNTSPRWKIGDSVDALDKIDVWGPACIIGKRNKINLYHSCTDATPQIEFRVQFYGWSENFNEWVTGDHLARLGSKSINPRNLFDSLSQDHKSWALTTRGENENEWFMDAITVTNISGNTKTIATQEHTFQIHKNNITKHIRVSSNTATFLCLPQREFVIKGRNINL